MKLPVAVFNFGSDCRVTVSHSAPIGNHPMPARSDTDILRPPSSEVGGELLMLLLLGKILISRLEIDNHFLFTTAINKTLRKDIYPFLSDYQDLS